MSGWSDRWRAVGGTWNSWITSSRSWRCWRWPRRHRSWRRLGREALDRLRVLDEVAYLRFASVYKSFRDATDFQRELTELEEEQMGSAQVER